MLKQSVSSVETSCFTSETICFFTWYNVKHRFVRLPLTRIVWSFRTVFKGCIAVVYSVGSIHAVNTYISLSNVRNVEMYSYYANFAWESYSYQSLNFACLHFFTNFGSRSERAHHYFAGQDGRLRRSEEWRVKSEKWKIYVTRKSQILLFRTRITRIERILFFEHRKTLKALKVQRKIL